MKMRVRFQDGNAPYPFTILNGRLRLSGLSDLETSSIIDSSFAGVSHLDSWNEADIITSIECILEKYPKEVHDNFRLLTSYEQTREDTNSTPPLILVLEGASATGKSMLAIELVRDLAATRFISTDTIRQVIRGIYSKQDHPELFCHTYQAFKFRQSGDSSLDPIIRGYIAQSEIVMQHTQDVIRRILDEGANAVVEGVHIQPGQLRNIDTNILEIVLNPSSDTHKSMFLSKNSSGKLRSVSQDTSVRTQEFETTRMIQDYLVSCALKQKVPVVKMENYEQARKEISKLIIDVIRKLPTICQ
jgi:2-phosphoglycerate kinase